MSKPRNSAKAAATTPVLATASPTALPAPEADFDDTIAHNRSLPLLDHQAIPHPPRGYRPTNPDIRRARLRRFAGDLRSESMDALREAASRDLQAELGRFAPDPQRAAALAERLTLTGEAVARAEALLAYAREIDQIALSDAFLILDLENKQYTNAVAHDPSLLAHYRALVKLFEARSGAITEGIARAKSAEAAAPAPAPNGKDPA
jgi:hypothetical protein